MSNVVKLSYKNFRVKIDCSDPGMTIGLKESLTVSNPKAAYCDYVPTHISAITPHGTCEIGLTDLVMSTVKKLDPNTVIEMTDELREQWNPMNAELIPFDHLHFKLRDYQHVCVSSALAKGRGLIESPTASGKSYIIYSLIRNLIHQCNHDATILLLVPTVQLVYQMKKEFVKYGEFEGMSSPFSSKVGFRNCPKTNVIISNRQWLLGRHKELPPITHVIVDEVQMLGNSANTVSKFVKSLPTPFKFGLSGTIPTDTEKFWNCQAVIGDVIFSERAYQMINRKVCAELSVNAIQIDWKNPPVFKRTDDNYMTIHMEERSWLQNNPQYRGFLQSLSKSLEGNTLYLFDNTTYGEQLYEEFTIGMPEKTVMFIDGSISIDDRLKMCSIIEQRNDIVLIAQNRTFSEGVDVQNLDNIILDSGKALTGIIQGIGRLLRKVHDLSTAVVWDVHSHLKYSNGHYEERLVLYDEHYDIDVKPKDVHIIKL